MTANKMIGLASDSCCPFCESQDTSYESTTVDSGLATQEVSCLECEREWIEQYTLTQILSPQWDVLADAQVKLKG